MSRHEHFSIGDPVVPNEYRFKKSLNAVAAQILLKELSGTPLTVVGVKEVSCKEGGKANGGGPDVCCLDEDGSVVHVISCHCYHRGEQIITLQVNGLPETYSADLFKRPDN